MANRNSTPTVAAIHLAAAQYCLVFRSVHIHGWSWHPDLLFGPKNAKRPIGASQMSLFMFAQG